MADFDIQVNEQYRLNSAQIYYHLPDYPKFLQEFIWQDYDLAPAFPHLKNFLGFWVDKIEGRLHSVYVAHQKVITASDAAFADFEGTIQ